jgi:hypothetical protein
VEDILAPSSSSIAWSHGLHSGSLSNDSLEKTSSKSWNVLGTDFQNDFKGPEFLANASESRCEVVELAWMNSA